MTGLATAANHDCKYHIREVWDHNLEEEFAVLRDLVVRYPYIALNLVFPGVVARPVGNFSAKSTEALYQQLRVNVDLLKIVQLGLTLSDEHGNFPKDACTWQFSFRFALNEDMYAPESIEALVQSGIHFKRHEQEGIDPNRFGELLISSGLILVEDTRWVTFHGGNDFAYLLKVLTDMPMPETEEKFFNLLQLFFPALYDVEYLMKSCKTLKGALNDVATDLGVERIGPRNHAGSDSMLTAFVFFKMRQTFFNDELDAGFLGNLALQAQPGKNS